MNSMVKFVGETAATEIELFLPSDGEEKSENDGNQIITDLRATANDCFYFIDQNVQNEIEIYETVPENEEFDVKVNELPSNDNPVSHACPTLPNNRMGDSVNQNETDWPKDDVNVEWDCQKIDSEDRSADGNSGINRDSISSKITSILGTEGVRLDSNLPVIPEKEVTEKIQELENGVTVNEQTITVGTVLEQLDNNIQETAKPLEETESKMESIDTDHKVLNTPLDQDTAEPLVETDKDSEINEVPQNGVTGDSLAVVVLSTEGGQSENAETGDSATVLDVTGSSTEQSQAPSEENASPVVENENSDVDRVCQQCERTFSHPKYLKMHLKVFHSPKEDNSSEMLENADPETSEHPSEEDNVIPEAPTVCHLCDKVCSQPRYLQMHMKYVHYNRSPSKRHRSVDTVKSDQPLSKEQNIVSPSDQAVVCHLCNKKCSKPQYLHVHMKFVHFNKSPPWKNSKPTQTPEHSASPIHVCKICNKVFAQRKSLNQHKKMHAVTNEENVASTKKRVPVINCTVIPNVGDKSKKSSEKKPKNVQQREVAKEEESKNTCSICKIDFPFLRGLQRHLKSHAPRKSYFSKKCAVTCDICSMKFVMKAHLATHRATHTAKLGRRMYPRKQKSSIPKERPHKCDDCEYAFIHKRDLVRHSRTHSGEKPYLCSVCPKTFGRDDYLLKHFRVHTGEKPYPCSYDGCVARFPLRGAQVSHYRMYHGEGKKRSAQVRKKNVEKKSDKKGRKVEVAGKSDEKAQKEDKKSDKKAREVGKKSDEATSEIAEKVDKVQKKSDKKVTEVGKKSDRRVPTKERSPKVIGKVVATSKIAEKIKKERREKAVKKTIDVGRKENVEKPDHGAPVKKVRKVEDLGNVIEMNGKKKIEKEKVVKKARREVRKSARVPEKKGGKVTGKVTEKKRVEGNVKEKRKVKEDEKEKAVKKARKEKDVKKLSEKEKNEGGKRVSERVKEREKKKGEIRGRVMKIGKN